MQFRLPNIKPAYLTIFTLLITFVAYFPALQNGFTNWDDPIYVTDNEFIQSVSWQYLKIWFTQPFQGLYQPLVLASLSIDYSINGLDPFYFHLTNLILHLCNTLLVFVFIRKLFNNSLIGFLVMILFGIHPLHVESVAWITERKDLLYSFFLLIALNFYLVFQHKRKKRFYIFVFIFFLLALLSKVSAVILPILLVLIDFYQRRKLLDRNAIGGKIPFFAIAFAFGIWNIITHSEFGSLANYSNLSLPARILLAPKGLMYFIMKTIFPINLSAYNPLPMRLTSILIVESLGYLFLFLIIVVVLIKIKSRILIFGALFFLASIIFFLVPPGEPVLVYERYSYISSIGLFILIAHPFKMILTQSKSVLIRSVVLIILVFWMGFLVVKTHQQTQIWKNSFSLWNHVIEVRGESFLALLQRGNVFTKLGNYDAAIEDYNRSITLNPNYYKTFDRRGHVYLLRENYPAAIDDFTTSLDLNSENTFSQLGLGFAYRKIGEFENALQHFNKAIQIDPQNPESYYNRGKVYLMLNKNEGLCSDFNKALQLGLKEENRKEAIDLLNSLCK